MANQTYESSKTLKLGEPLQAIIASGQNPDGSARHERGDAELLLESSVTFPNSAAANTSLSLPDIPSQAYYRSKRLLIVGWNPSTVSALTVTPRLILQLGGATRVCSFSDIATSSLTFTVGLQTATSRIFPALPMLDGIRITVQNNTALGTADTFTTNFKVYLI